METKHPYETKEGNPKKSIIIIIGSVFLMLVCFSIFYVIGSDLMLAHKLRRVCPPLAQTTSPKILPSDFEIVSGLQEWTEDGLYAICEIKNNGDTAGSPVVEIIARNSAGVLLDASTFWPNSIRNVPPGGTCGLKRRITQDRRVETLEIKIVDVDVW